MTPKTEFDRQVKILKQVKRIAVVGMSPNSDRPSHEVGLYLRDQGFEVVPVHPTAQTIEGLHVQPSLTAAASSGPIDLADLFVAGERAMPIVLEAHALGIKRIWFQPGAENAEAESHARHLGLEVVTRACTMAVLMRAQG